MARTMIFVLVLTLAGAITALAVENRGPAEMRLDGGSRGVVPFPHQRHQDTLGDCDVCHTLFPKEQGGIARLKREGVLVKKQVMKKHCIQCHQSKKKTGETAGPTKCAKCHVKDKA